MFHLTDVRETDSWKSWLKCVLCGQTVTAWGWPMSIYTQYVVNLLCVNPHKMILGHYQCQYFFLIFSGGMYCKKPLYVLRYSFYFSKSASNVLLFCGTRIWRKSCTMPGRSWQDCRATVAAWQPSFLPRKERWQQKRINLINFGEPYKL